ncbi:MAG: hypothetical protein GY856_36905 [bacterium]|nr:hypothetical protein [bacterium]
MTPTRTPAPTTDKLVLTVRPGELAYVLKLLRERSDVAAIAHDYDDVLFAETLVADVKLQAKAQGVEL